MITKLGQYKNFILYERQWFYFFLKKKFLFKKISGFGWRLSVFVVKPYFLIHLISK